MISFKRKQLLGLACDRNHSILLLADKTKGQSRHTIVATTDSPMESDVTIPRLLASAGNVKGDVRLVLPLEYFEVVSINIPRMPDESVGKIIPYHLRVKAPVTRRPPHSPGREDFPHPVPQKTRALRS